MVCHNSTIRTVVVIVYIRARLIICRLKAFIYAASANCLWACSGAPSSLSVAGWRAAGLVGMDNRVPFADSNLAWIENPRPGSNSGLCHWYNARIKATLLRDHPFVLQVIVVKAS